ncbi:MAG: ABC transporter substrate-binding protein [Pyrobaculum sp.]
MIFAGELDGVPKVVVSLNPSVNEFLALLGVGLAGRDAFSYRPRELLKVPRVGTFIDADLDALAKLAPDLVVLYYPVQRRLFDKVAAVAKAVVAVPTPVNVDHAVSIFRFFARLFDSDEEGDRLAGVYRDLLRGSPIYDDVVALINLGVYDLVCTSSYAADALTRVGFRYLSGLRCVFKHSADPPWWALERANFVVYESRGRSYDEAEVAFLRGKDFVVTPNDTIAHYGPSLPLDLQKLWHEASRGGRWVGETSSVLRPSLRDSWYSPYR